MHKSEAYRNIIVFITSYENGIPVGSLSNAYYEETQSFQSLTNLLLLIEQILNRVQLGHTFERLCDISPPSAVLCGASNAMSGDCDVAATFSVRIMFCCNASWQGSIRWIEGGTERSFRSALELIFLIDSALKRNNMEENHSVRFDDGRQMAVN